MRTEARIEAASPVASAVAVERRYLRRLKLSALPLLALLLLAGILALGLGSVSVSPGAIIGILLSKLPGLHVLPSWAPGQETIILQLRLPRVLLVGLCGGALAVAGATYQGLFRNPLGDPYLLGVAPGAGFGATLAIVFALDASLVGLGTVPVAAFAGGLVASTVIYLLARVDRHTSVSTLTLAGVAMGSLLSAMTSAVMIAHPERLQQAIFWLFGSFSATTWSMVAISVPYLALGLALAFVHARPLNILLLDEEQAQQLGIEVERTKVVLIVAATLLTATVVAVSGPIGFVGLIAPHAARLIWGPDYRVLLPTSALVGGLFLILADLLARAAIPPQELPVGVISALCGAPFFLYLLRQRRKAVL